MIQACHRRIQDVTISCPTERSRLTSARIETLQRRYAVYLLTLPTDHPIRSKGPATLPNNTGLGLPRDSLWTEWDDSPAPNKPFHNRIDRFLHGIALWITRTSKIYRTNYNAAPWGG
jgi:hypothetical protein